MNDYTELVPQPPPLDGKPCVFCPRELRDLYRSALGLILAAERGQHDQLSRRLALLRGSLISVQDFYLSHEQTPGHAYESVPTDGGCA